jgi:hypothetical protein
MKKPVLAATAILMALTTPAFAAGGNYETEHGIGARFNAIDTNDDGALSPQEIADANDHYFDEADINADGTVTRDELTQWNQHDFKEGLKRH